MDYLFENLSDEKFQEFCQCLVTKEFPHSQAFPVGQRDGGRDAVVYTMNSVKKDFVVFQVKYVRNPYQITDTHKWLVQTIEGEVEKINRLIPKGARAYYLLTNVKGTAPLEFGSIDKLNGLLEDKVNIPSICWWRDDLARKLETDQLLKWSYPEILNGQDILNSALFSNLNDHKERRENAIRAYLIDQYEMDNEVKFRQIDLQNHLFDLFTDVPIRIKKFNEKNKAIREVVGSFENNQKKLLETNYNNDDKNPIGAADFLLHPIVQRKLERVLLEGGPGQGKSTISQYICQVNRAKLLKKTNDISKIPNNIKDAPVRFPFKIDLRHIASWVENKNPYQGTLSDEYFSKNWQRSLESFLVGHIFYHSKLEDFNTSDLIAICKLSPILFVFDGFDEIANLKVRGEVIEFINKGINRISENSHSIQIVITSRPAAFSDMVGFSSELYPHFELTEITPGIIKEYVEKWIKASRLDSKESALIRRLVEEKLKMPHLKDLAKSPMQLAIFISLLKTKGESLPNKRTALYDSYVDLFFDRESEKSVTIRDNRDLIIDIHQYLGWLLHSEAELFKNSGSIHIDPLKTRLKEYLQNEGHDTDIADVLFNVVKERVCALASRVQGTFEFEVQPLREYFCAKYLYKTAPYSPTGAERSGTLPDRFEAIAKNFYWQNVLRFFCGCFNKGELPMLIDQLKLLQKDELLKYTNYPRLLTSQLLSDYVFKQYPLYLTDVIKLIVEGIYIGGILNQSRENLPTYEPILLPIECGRKEVLLECFNQLTKIPQSDYAMDLIGLIKNNNFQTEESWTKEALHLNGERLTIWLRYAYNLEIIHEIEDEVLLRILKEDKTAINKRLQILIQGNRLEFIDKHFELKELVFKGALDDEFFVFRGREMLNSLQFLSFCFQPFFLSSIFRIDIGNISYTTLITRRFHYPYPKSGSSSIYNFHVKDEIDSKIKSFSEEIKTVFDTEIYEWRKSIEPWDQLIEKGRKYFGESWTFKIIAVIAAGIKSKDERHDDYSNFNDAKLSLCKRVRFARLKSGNKVFWETEIKSTNDLLTTLLIFFTWGTPKIILELLKSLDEVINCLNRFEYNKLANALNKTLIKEFSHSQFETIIIGSEEKDISDKLKYLLSLRFTEENKNKYIYENIKEDLNFFPNVLEIKLDYLIRAFIRTSDNKDILNEIKRFYSKIGIRKSTPDFIYYPRHISPSDVRIPLDLAKQIMDDCANYPRIIGSLAESSCRIHANDNLISVGEVAVREHWFD